MRCDVNVSVRPTGQEEFGTKVEVKNMNSFSAMQKAIDFEIDRQVSLLSLAQHQHCMCAITPMKGIVLHVSFARSFAPTLQMLWESASVLTQHTIVRSLLTVVSACIIKQSLAVPLKL